MDEVRIWNVARTVRQIGEQMDELIQTGTAGLVRYFHGNHLVLINRDATPMDGQCDLVIHDKVGEVLSSIT